MANKNKHLKNNVKQKNSKKRAAEKTAPKNNEKFNFDNEIVIGVNVVPKSNKDKPSSGKKYNSKKESKNKIIKEDYKKTKKQKEVKRKKGKNSEANNKRKTRIKKIIKIIFFITIIVGVIIFVMTTPLFNITNIKVTGNSEISEERIKSLSQISLNNNTFKYSKRNIINNIKDEPYIEDVKVKRKLPNIVEINVCERKISYVMQYAGGFIYIDKSGYILEISNETTNVPVIEGYSTLKENIIPNNKLCEEDLEKLNTVGKIMDTCKSNGIAEQITLINIENKNDYIVAMENEGKKIYLGDASNINDKVLMLKEILNKEKGNIGNIYIRDLNKIYFSPTSN